MDDREHGFWLAYIRGIADRLGLKDWDLRLSRDDTDPDSGATIHTWYGQKRATIRLNHDVFRLSSPAADEDQRRYVVHELLHCHFEYFEENRRAAEKIGERSEREQLQDAFDKRAIETVIDNLATVIARLFELPAPIGGPS